MARTAQFRDEDILKAAREVFLERGLRATALEVAARAGVSEGTVFHHFKTKSALFQAAVNPKLDAVREIDGLPAQVGKGTVAENLVAFGNALLESMRVHVPFMMLAFANSEAGERARMTCEFEPAHGRLLRLLAGYFDGEMRAGRVRQVDPEILARLMMGGLFDYVRSEAIGGTGALPLPSSMFLRGLVDIILNGTSARPVADIHPRRPRRSRPAR